MYETSMVSFILLPNICVNFMVYLLTIKTKHVYWSMRKYHSVKLIILYNGIVIRITPTTIYLHKSILLNCVAFNFSFFLALCSNLLVFFSIRVFIIYDCFLVRPFTYRVKIDEIKTEQ